MATGRTTENLSDAVNCQKKRSYYLHTLDAAVSAASCLSWQEPSSSSPGLARDTPLPCQPHLLFLDLIAKVCLSLSVFSFPLFFDQHSLPDLANSPAPRSLIFRLRSFGRSLHVLCLDLDPLGSPDHGCAVLFFLHLFFRFLQHFLQVLPCFAANLATLLLQSRAWDFSMESKDLAHETYPLLEPRAKRAPLHLDPSTFVCRMEDDFNLDSAVSSPSSAASQSPLTPLPPHNHLSTELDITKEPASGPHRTKSSPPSGTKMDKEKRKRSRVTPEQLVHLERFFSVDRSPTAARRREISELLGMQERQTQIWFQNRRAKAKLQDGKQKGRSGSADTPPDTPPELSTGFEVDLHNLIHEDEPVTIIPCTDLSIGTWRRIATTVGKHDLVAYVCDSKRCLTWFIHSAGYGFKMEIPFEIILDTEFANAAPGSGLASFVLSQPPVFYMENVSSPRPDGSVVRDWKRCADWTEGHQATKVLRHDLIGSAVQLAHLLRNLQASGSDIALHSPSYSGSTESPPAPMELPQPPLAGLTGPGFLYHGDDLESSTPENHLRVRKRSESGPTQAPLLHTSSFPVDADSRILQGPSSVPFSDSLQLPVRSTQSSPNFASPPFSDFSGSDHHHSLRHSHSPLSEYGSVAISHGLTPRPYSAQPVPRTFYQDDTRFVSSFRGGGLRRHSTSILSHPYTTPSPPLLTTPYHPRMETLNSGHHDALTTTAAVISGLPGVPYESDDEVQL